MKPTEAETMTNVKKERNRMSRERFIGFMGGRKVNHEMTEGPGKNLRVKRKDGNSQKGAL
jgi:hypothetical protein